MKINERIKQTRKRLGYSQELLGSRVGVSRVSISQWERGENTPNGRYLNELAAALGVTVDWLLTGEDSSTGQQLSPIQFSTGSGKSIATVALVRKLFEQMKAEDKAAFKSSVIRDGNNSELYGLLQELGLSGDEDKASPEFSNVEPALIPLGRSIPILSYVQAGNWREMCEQATAFDGNVEYVSAGGEIGPYGFGLWLRGDSMVPLFKEGDLIIVDPDESPQPGDYVVAKNGSGEATFKKYRPRGIDENGQEVFELVPLNDDYPSMHSDRQHIYIIGVMVEHRSFRKRQR